MLQAYFTCFSTPLRVHHQSHVQYPTDIQFLSHVLANISTVTISIASIIRCCNLPIINVSDFDSVNDIFYIAPQEKIQRCDIRGTWRPWNGTITSNPPIWKCFIQKLTNFKAPIRWCTVLLENNLWLILFKLWCTYPVKTLR